MLKTKDFKHFVQIEVKKRIETYWNYFSYTKYSGKLWRFKYEMKPNFTNYFSKKKTDLFSVQIIP